MTYIIPILPFFQKSLNFTATENWKTLSLPLARVKKIMKSEEFALQELERERLQQQNPDQNVEVDRTKIKFMISHEAPILVTKACELFVKELTIRAWHHTERNRRRTLQKADLHAAVGESEVFDFLIDTVPRVVTAIPLSRVNVGHAAPHGLPNIPMDQMYMNLPNGDMPSMPQDLQQFGYLLQSLPTADVGNLFNQPLSHPQQANTDSQGQNWTDPPV